MSFNQVEKELNFSTKIDGYEIMSKKLNIMLNLPYDNLTVNLFDFNGFRYLAIKRKNKNLKLCLTHKITKVSTYGILYDFWLLDDLKQKLELRIERKLKRLGLDKKEYFEN